jgi:predicted esterase
MRKIVKAGLPFDYHLQLPLNERPEEVILLLHGYSESGTRILNKAGPAIPDSLRARAAVFAPNGPFPLPILPEKAGDPYKVGFSWYFYDRSTQQYYIDMETAIEFLSAGLEALQLESLPKRIIGFSQGGYLATLLGARLDSVKQVVGIACEYLHDEVLGKVQYRLDGIHGADDPVVSLDDAKESYAQMKHSRSLTGEFVELPSVGHRIDSTVQKHLCEILNQVHPSQWS